MRIHNFLIIMLLTSCSSPKQEKRAVLPHNSQVIARFIVHDEKNSPQLSKCSDARFFFKDVGSNCTFLLDGMEFDIEYKYVLDGSGRIKEFWPYIAEGPYVEDDSSALAQSVEKDFLIRLSKDREYIIDCGDTLAITHIFENEQLLFAEKSPKTMAGRRWIYQYR